MLAQLLLFTWIINIYCAIFVCAKLLNGSWCFIRRPTSFIPCSKAITHIPTTITVMSMSIELRSFVIRKIWNALKCKNAFFSTCNRLLYCLIVPRADAILSDASISASCSDQPSVCDLIKLLLFSCCLFHFRSVRLIKLFKDGGDDPLYISMAYRCIECATFENLSSARTLCRWTCVKKYTTAPHRLISRRKFVAPNICDVNALCPLCRHFT